MIKIRANISEQVVPFKASLFNLPLVCNDHGGQPNVIDKTITVSNRWYAQITICYFQIISPFWICTFKLTPTPSPPPHLKSASEWLSPIQYSFHQVNTTNCNLTLSGQALKKEMFSESYMRIKFTLTFFHIKKQSDLIWWFWRSFPRDRQKITKAGRTF